MKRLLSLFFIVASAGLCLNASGQSATVVPNSLPAANPNTNPPVQPSPVVPKPAPLTPSPTTLTPSTNAAPSGPPNIMAPTATTTTNSPGSPGK